MVTVGCWGSSYRHLERGGALVDLDPVVPALPHPTLLCLVTRSAPTPPGGLRPIYGIRSSRRMARGGDAGPWCATAGGVGRWTASSRSDLGLLVGQVAELVLQELVEGAQRELLDHVDGPRHLELGELRRARLDHCCFELGGRRVRRGR